MPCLLLVLAAAAAAAAASTTTALLAFLRLVTFRTGSYDNSRASYY